VVRFRIHEIRDFAYFDRLAGYSVVDIMNLNPGNLIAYVVAMYISIYPVTIMMRNSNVYQVSIRFKSSISFQEHVFIRNVHWGFIKVLMKAMDTM
jgi:Trk-type K+ transport system membrane component